TLRRFIRDSLVRWCVSFFNQKTAYGIRDMKVYKMGDGPLYTFYTPFHLSPLEAPNSVARAMLFGDAPVTPLAGPVCDVITIAKRELKAGERLDGIGGFLTYGTIDNTDTCAIQNLLPMGL